MFGSIPLNTTEGRWLIRGGGKEEGNMAGPLKPGQPAPSSGQYENRRTGTEVTVVRGEPMPPTPKKGDQYVIVDRTRHKRQK